MKVPVFFTIALLAGGLAQAQEWELDTNALRQAFEVAGQWAETNLNEDALSALQQVDREKVEEFLRSFQQQLQSEYVLDLAALKDAASGVLPPGSSPAKSRMNQLAIITATLPVTNPNSLLSLPVKLPSPAKPNTLFEP